MLINKFKDSFCLLPKKIKWDFFMMIFYSILISLFEFFGIASIPILISNIFNFKANKSLDYIEKLNLNFIEILDYELILILIGIIFFTKFLLSINFQYQESSFRKKISEYFRIQLFQKFLQLDYLNQINFKKGDLLKRIISDPSSLASLLINFINVLKDFFIIFIILIFMLVFNLKVTLVSIFIIFALSYIFIIVFRKSVKIWGIKDQKLRSELNDIVDSSFTSLKEIKVMGFELKFISLFSNVTKSQASLDFKNRFISNLPKVIFEIIIIISILSFLYYSYNFQFDIKYSLIQLSVYIYAFSRLLPPSNAIVSNIVSSHYFIPSVDFIKEGMKIINNKKKFLNKKLKLNYYFDNFKNISFKNVYLNHKDKYLIKEINFSILKNKINLIKGPSGAGKSTCLNILCGLIRPTKGAIFFDDKLTKLYNNSLWQSKISYVTQSNYLFNTSILENITFQSNLDCVDKDKFEFAIKLSNINKIFNLKKIKNFIVGINGSRVSGGQAQKILFARSLYFGQDVLILDEPTNGLDQKSKKEMINSLKLLVKKYNYTIILSTHENLNNLDCNYIKLNKKI